MACRIENCEDKFTDIHYLDIELPTGEKIKDLTVSLCVTHSKILNLQPEVRQPVKTHWWKRL